MTVIDLKTGKETELPKGTRLACALGNFDGVHIGHRELLLKAAKKEYGATASAVWTFRVHPQLCLGNKNVKIITPIEQKLEYFKEAGIEYAILEDFPRVSSLSPKQFAKKLETLLSLLCVLKLLEKGKRVAIVPQCTVQLVQGAY